MRLKVVAVRQKFAVDKGTRRISRLPQIFVHEWDPTNTANDASNITTIIHVEYWDPIDGQKNLECLNIFAVPEQRGLCKVRKNNEEKTKHLWTAGVVVGETMAGK